MSSSHVGQPGCQRPRVRVAPRTKRSEADDAEYLAAGYGLKPDEWQRLVLEDWLAVRPDGRWASLTCGLAVPRQNGKNGVIEMRELYGLVVLGEKFLHTAHEVKTARKAFQRLASFFDNAREYPELAELVKEIRRTNGQEAIVLTNGGSVEFVARSKGSGRGFTVDVLVMDEAQELEDDALEALMPTTAAAPLGNPQWIMTGTPPGPKAHGEVFTRTRTEALERKSTRLCWHEWSADGVVDLDDRSLWLKTNPALGARLQFDVLEGERARFSDEGFGRERLGMWSGASGQAVISPDAWRDLCAPDGTKMPRPYSLAVEVDPDQSVATVAGAGQLDDDRWLVRLRKQDKGIDWLPDYVAECCADGQVSAVVVDGRTEAASWLIDELGKRRVRATKPTAGEVSSAFSLFVSGANEDWLRHGNQDELTTSLLTARKKVLNGHSSWNPASSAGDITAIRSATLALWGAHSTTTKRPMRTRTPRVVVLGD